jgi:hypothetical protein
MRAFPRIFGPPSNLSTNAEYRAKVIRVALALIGRLRRRSIITINSMSTACEQLSRMDGCVLDVMLRHVPAELHA